MREILPYHHSPLSIITSEASVYHAIVVVRCKRLTWMARDKGYWHTTNGKDVKDKPIDFSKLSKGAIQELVDLMDEEDDA